MADYVHSSNFHKIVKKIEETTSIKDAEILRSKLQSLEQDDEVVELLEKCDDRIDQIKNLIKEEKYQAALSELEKSESDIDSLISQFQEIRGYKDSDEYLDSLKKEKEYRYLVNLFESKDCNWEEVYVAFKDLGDYKDSKEYSDKCYPIVEKQRKEKEIQDRKKKDADNEAKYKEAVSLMEKGQWTSACEMFNHLENYRDSKQKKDECNDKLFEQAEKEKKKRKKTLIIILSCALVGLLVIMLCIGLTEWTRDDIGHWHSFLSFKLGYSEHDYVLISDASPTCENSARKGFECKTCGWYHSEFFESLGHQYETEILEPTCTIPGTKKSICTRCGKIEKTEIIPATGHSYELVNMKEPTCGANGEHSYLCLVCGETYNEIIPATGNHQFAEAVVLKEPTCEERGLASMTCLLCGNSETTIIDAKGHSWDEAEVIKDASCEEDGSMSRKCLVCGKSEIFAIPALGHSFNVTSEQKPGCTMKGFKVLKCDVCGTVKKDYYSEALGHEYNDGLCIRCGFDRNIYSVGMVGPAGGIIIYDCEAKDRDYSNRVLSTNTGWRFLEIAPSALGSFVFGKSSTGEYPTTKSGIGAGISNTEQIVKSFGDSVFTRDGKQTSQYAARVCYEYNLNGFNDWFLPSLYELLIFYDGKRTEKNTWSSVIDTYSRIFYVDRFGDSGSDNYDYGSDYTLSVHPMRVF